jgi:uncharacterized protein YciI
MEQYLIHAFDGTDSQAQERRMRVRPVHLEGVKHMRSRNQYIVGGAILNDQEQMIGSVMIVQFETEEEFQQWYKQEPYVTEGVWEKIEVRRFRTAFIPQLLVLDTPASDPA